jgi:hypothetical protein
MPICEKADHCRRHIAIDTGVSLLVANLTTAYSSESGAGQTQVAGIYKRQPGAWLKTHICR